MATRKRSNFSRPTKDAAFVRQQGRCAMCGKDLWNWLISSGNMWEAHHIRRDADNGVSTIDNCVILCTNDEDSSNDCHFKAHGYNYRMPFILDTSKYKYFEFNFLTGKYKGLKKDYEPKTQ